MSLSLRSLVPAAGDVVAKVDSSGAPEASALADSSGGAPKPTYTIDSEISPLLPKSLRGMDNSDSGLVTILRGGGKGSDAVASQQPAPKGS